MIYIKPLEYKWEIDELEKLKMTKAQRQKFYDKIAIMYVDYAKGLIKRQYYAWRPLSKPYRRWKKRMGLNLGKWIATGKLHDRIRYTKSTKTVGFGNARYSNGIYINKVARVLEYGSPIKNIPPRPLFRTALRYFEIHRKKIVKEVLMEITV